MHPGDAVKRGELLRRLGLAAAFLALGACLLLAGRGMSRADGVSVVKTELPGGKGKLYVPASEAALVLPAHEEGEETVRAGGEAAGALILAHRLDGAENAALELCRRGVAVLVIRDGTEAESAWDWLLSQPFIRRSGGAILSSAKRAGEALALAAGLAGTPRPCAAVVLTGDKALAGAAAGNPAANVLVLTGGKAGEEELAAFYGSREAARLGFAGYFGEGTARACAAVGGDDPSFFRRSVLERTMDWLGSSLGHRVEIADSDLICGKVLGWRIAGALCLACGAGWICGCGKKKEQTD